MRDTIFCKHYRAMSDNKTCKVDVPYEQFKGLDFVQRPCFMRGGEICGGCDKQEFPTPEEIAAEDAETEAYFAKIVKARVAIVESLGGKWKKGTPGAAGKIDCPVCGGKEFLRFTRAGYNGHIHAMCKTEGCVRWME